MEERFDVIVIGAGPGGYVAAIKCAQLGMKVACIESSATLGGTCLNVGCIPSKALLHTSYKYYDAKHNLKDLGIQTNKVTFDLNVMMKHKQGVVNELTKGIEFLFNKNKITWVKGMASFTSASQVKIYYDNKEFFLESKYFIIATGSKVSTVPNITIDEKRIVSSTGVLSLDNVPDELVVMGGGYIGLEMASIWSRLGSKVSVVEFASRLIPAMDEEISKTLQTILESQGLKFYLQHKVLQAKVSDKGVMIQINSEKEKTSEILANVMLVAVGRSPNTDGLNLDELGIQKDVKGFISVDQSYQTSVKNIYAIGDVIGGMMLAHKAEDEGVVVAEIISGHRGHVNYRAIPAVIYTHPEVAYVGKTEAQLKSDNIKFKVAKFPMNINGRAKAMADTKGFVKILSDQVTDEVLGVHIIAADAGSLIAEAALGMEYRASAEDIARTCHAHPTTSEALKEAAMIAWSGKAIHL